MCKSEIDSIEHMLLECQHSKTLWDNISVWIRELGMADYNLTTTWIIIGDLANALAIISIILHTKKVIYNSKKKELKPNIKNVKHEVKNFYYQVKYRH